MRPKNILIILGVLALIAVVAFGLYVWLGHHASSTTTTTAQTGSLPIVTSTGNNSGGTQPTSATTTTTQTFGIILNQPVLDYFVDGNNVVTAIEPTGQIVQVTNGTVTTLSSLAIQNIMSVGFSYDGKMVLVNFGDPQNPQTSVFNVAKQTWTPMPQGWQSPVWSLDDYRIAYGATTQNGAKAFYTLDASKTKPSPVLLTSFYIQEPLIAWVSQTRLAIATKPSDYAAGSAWLFDLQKGTLTPVSIEVPGLEALWSGTSLNPTAQMGLLFSAGSYGTGGSLSLVNSSGGFVQELKFLTLPTKCAFSSVTSTLPIAAQSSTAQTAQPATTSTPYLYCAIPRNQDVFSSSNLPDAYNQMALFTSDDIYSTNLENGSVGAVFADQTQSLDVSDMRIFNSTLFFVNRYDQKLYGLQLAASE